VQSREINKNKCRIDRLSAYWAAKRVDALKLGFDRNTDFDPKGRKIAPQRRRRLLQLQKSKSLMALPNQAANCHAADARQIPTPENHSYWTPSPKQLSASAGFLLSSNRDCWIADPVKPRKSGKTGKQFPKCCFNVP
jgi:hypothetical protein